MACFLSFQYGSNMTDNVEVFPHGHQPWFAEPEIHEHDDELVAPEATVAQKVMMLTAVIVPFVGCITAVVLFLAMGWMHWSFGLMVVAGWASTTLGITIGFHRLLSHRSFETFRWVKAFWMMVGSMSVEGAPLTWCAVHRRHHGHSDQAGDPHSPNLDGPGIWGLIKGLWHGQVGWLFSGYWSKPDMEKYVPDLIKDRLLVWINRYYFLFVLASLAVPTVAGMIIQYFFIDGNIWFGALLGFLWGGLVRIFLTHHVTWSINSICHVFGKRQFRSGDHSTNNMICAVMSMGEGWHNNHHAFPSSARHGLLWYQFDMSWLIIRTMETLGLAWDVKLPSKRSLEARRIR